MTNEGNNVKIESIPTGDGGGRGEGKVQCRMGQSDLPFNSLPTYGVR